MTVERFICRDMAVYCEYSRQSLTRLPTLNRSLTGCCSSGLTVATLTKYNPHTERGRATSLSLFCPKIGRHLFPFLCPKRRTTSLPLFAPFHALFMYWFSKLAISKTYQIEYSMIIIRRLQIQKSYPWVNMAANFQYRSHEWVNNKT